MPRIKMLTGLAGENREPGDILDLPANEAQFLIDTERAELVRSEPLETPERGSARENAKRGKARETRG